MSEIEVPGESELARRNFAQWNKVMRISAAAVRLLEVLPKVTDSDALEEYLDAEEREALAELRKAVEG